MLNRRRILKALAAPRAPRPRPRPRGRAQARRRSTFCSWGGALSDLEKTAFLDPFAKDEGIEVVHASPTNYAKLKAMVEAGSPEWDLVDVGGRFIFQGADLLEPLDMALIPNAKTLDPGWVTPKGIFTSTGATVIAWNTKAFPEDKAPGLLEGLLGRARPSPARAASTSPSTTTTRPRCSRPACRATEVYPVTDEKVKLAMDKLRELKPHVKVWWTAGAQPPQLLVDRRARHVVRLVRPDLRGHEGERAGRDDLQRRHRLGERLGGAEGLARTRGSPWRRSTTRSPRRRRCGCSTSAPTARCCGAPRPRARRSSSAGWSTAPENASEHADHQRGAGGPLLREVRGRMEPLPARLTAAAGAAARVRAARLHARQAVQPACSRPRSIAFVGASAGRTRPATTCCA